MNRSACAIALLAIALLIPSVVQAQGGSATASRSSCMHSSQHTVSSMGTVAATGEGLFLSETQRNMIGSSTGNTISVGLTYHGAIGVQGLQFRITSPNPFLRFTRVGIGSGVKKKGGWFLDYEITNTLSGSELQVIAFGNDTTCNVASGNHVDLFRISYEVLAPGFNTSAGGNVKGMIYLNDVQSALAHNLGYSAGVKPATGRDTMRFTIYSPAVRHDLGSDNYGMSRARALHKVANPVTGIDASDRLSLQCSPNPLTETGLIHYNLSMPADVSIIIRDMQGMEVARLVDAEHQDAGMKEVRIDASSLPAGMYVCMMRAGERVEMQKLVVVR